MTYTPRYMEPNADNKAYIGIGYGGQNRALVVNRRTGSVLPNCTGYVHGRVIEVAGKEAEAKLCIGDAKRYYTYPDGFKRDKVPSVGSIVCWTSAQYGHVAFVEAVYDDGSIRISESNYGGEFRTRLVKRNNDGSYSALNPSNIFQGFVHVYQEEIRKIDPVKYGVYRLYNPNTGEHLFTADHSEAETIYKAGWNYEGIGWKYDPNGSPVYRLQKPGGGDHLLTTEHTEIGTCVVNGWSYEGIAFTSSSDDGQSVYRYYKDGTHMYTTSEAERAALAII